LAGEDRHDVPAPEIAEHGDQLVADTVAQVGRIDVRGVEDRAKAELCAQSMGLGAAEIKDRVARAGTHRREAVGGGAPEQVQKNGLGLVVGGVSGGGSRRQDPDSGGARSRLEVRAGTYRDAVNHHLNIEGASEVVDDNDVGLGPLAQAVVDMVRDDNAVAHDGENQQRERVCTP
jgi:hypothetical protein